MWKEEGMAADAGGNVYFEGCPGCAVDRRKAENPGVPYSSCIYVGLATLCSSLPISSLFPFFYYMTRDMQVAKRTEDIGFYAGFIGLIIGPALGGYLALKSIQTSSWGIGLIIGPALGGYLALPAEKYPNLFSPDSFFGRFPYFLPCLCTSAFAVVVLISCIWMPETLHKHHVSKKVKPSGSLDTKKSLLKNWPFMSSIIVYCVFSFHDTAYTEEVSLWAESDKKYGGLSLSSNDVGLVLAITGASFLLYQLFVYPRINNFFGPIKSSQIAAILCIPILFVYPYMTYLSGRGLLIVLSIASVIKYNLGFTIITSSFILQNNAVEQRCAANGVSMTGMSFFNAVAPASAGILFSWAQKRQHAFFFPGDQMVFFLLSVVGLLGVMFTFNPFLTEPEQYHRISTALQNKPCTCMDVAGNAQECEFPECQPLL